MKKLLAIFVTGVVSAFSVSAQTEFETILSQFHADSLRKTVEDLVAFDNRLCFATIGNNKKVAAYIVQRLKNYGVENTVIDSFHVSMYNSWLGNIDQTMYNVKGRLNGSVNPDSVVIIGAHLDAICYDANRVIQSTTPGANDNATGVAVMIEVARIFYANNLIPQYSIDFMAYDAEEIGLFGSRHDAQIRINNNEKVYVMLNNDMVGLQDKNAKTWKVTFHADAPVIENKAKTICRDYTLLQPDIPDNMDSSYRNSDSWAYRDRNFRTFYTHSYDEDPFYHSLLDLPQRLNYQYMTEIAKLHFSLLYDWAIENIIVITDGIAVGTWHAASLQVYPNPTSGKLQVTSYELQENSIVEIYDVVGQKLTNFQFSTINSQLNIDVSHLASGMYFLKVDNKVVRFVKK